MWPGSSSLAPTFSTWKPRSSCSLPPDYLDRIRVDPFSTPPVKPTTKSSPSLSHTCSLTFRLCLRCLLSHLSHTHTHTHTHPHKHTPPSQPRIPPPPTSLFPSLSTAYFPLSVPLNGLPSPFPFLSTLGNPNFPTSPSLTLIHHVIPDHSDQSRSL